MENSQRPTDSEHAGEEDSDTSTTQFWCVDCGMVFKRFCLEVNSAWCARCGAGGVQKLSWHGGGGPVANG
jgi:uncharacterized paraquat-inducible protein A